MKNNDQIKSEVEGSYPTFPFQPFSFYIKSEDDFPGNAMSMESQNLPKLEKVEDEHEACMDSKDFDMDSLDGQRFQQTTFDIKVEEHIKAEMINQQCMDSIKIEDKENVEMFDQKNTRAGQNDMDVVNVEDKIDDKQDEIDVKHTKHFQCRECGESFAFKNLLLKHEITHKRSENNNDPTCNTDIEGIAKETKSTSCEVCGKSLSSKKELIRHVNRVHKKIKPSVIRLSVNDTNL